MGGVFRHRPKRNVGTCDRCYVINEGEIAGELNKDEFSQERIMQLIMAHMRKGDGNGN